MFYSEKENLCLAENAIKEVVKKYTIKFNSFDKNSLDLFYYKYLCSVYNNLNYLLSNGKNCLYMLNSIKNKLKQFEYMNNITSLGNVKEIECLLESFKKEIQETYSKYSKCVRHATNVPNITELNCSNHCENQYFNEIVDAVFGGTGYLNMVDYILRANVRGMEFHNNFVIYPSSPFKDSKFQVYDDKIELKDSVYMYSMDISDFEPVIGIDKDSLGRYLLLFDNEWIARKNSVKCNCEQIFYVPIDILDSRQILYKKDKFDSDSLLANSYDESIKKLESSIQDGYLGYVNQDYNRSNIFYSQKNKN